MKKHKSVQLAAGLLLAASLAVTTAACGVLPPSPTGNSVMGAETERSSALDDLLVSLDIPTEPEETEPVTTPTTLMEKEVDSHRALFSISHGGGFGTIEDTATITITVYSNGLVGACKMGRQSPLAEMTQEDFEAVASTVTCEALEGMEVEEDWSVCDGGGRDITIYDEYGQLLAEKGGYCARGEEYNQLYWDTMRILRPYIPEWWQ